MRKFNIGDRVTMVTLPNANEWQPPKGLTSYLVTGILSGLAGGYYVKLSGDQFGWYDEKHFVREIRTYGRNYPSWF